MNLNISHSPVIAITGLLDYCLKKMREDGYTVKQRDFFVENFLKYGQGPLLSYGQREHMLDMKEKFFCLVYKGYKKNTVYNSHYNYDFVEHVDPEDTLSILGVYCIYFHDFVEEHNCQINDKQFIVSSLINKKY